MIQKKSKVALAIGAFEITDKIKEILDQYDEAVVYCYDCLDTNHDYPVFSMNYILNVDPTTEIIACDRLSKAKLDLYKKNYKYIESEV